MTDGTVVALIGAAAAVVAPTVGALGTWAVRRWAAARIAAAQERSEAAKEQRQWYLDVRQDARETREELANVLEREQGLREELTAEIRRGLRTEQALVEIGSGLSVLRSIIQDHIEQDHPQLDVMLDVMDRLEERTTLGRRSA